MNEVMGIASDNNINIYYQDTDSMHMEDDKVKDLEGLFKAEYNRELTGKELGQFHCDFSHQNPTAKNIVSVKSIFLGKKSYIDYLEGTLPDGTKSYCVHSRMKGINEIAKDNEALKQDGESMNDKMFGLYEDLANDYTIEFVLNPESKPSFKFTSEGVRLIKSGTFKREVNFI